MGRFNRLHVESGIFHVTHRCHNKAHFLKFARDRNAYRNKLRDHLKQVNVHLFDYTITTNHVHLLLETEEKSAVSTLMQQVAGEFASDYNRRKNRTNAVWGDCFHATLIEGGRYFFECLLYVELNMVRCGVVPHPREWAWGGYHEIMGNRRRYRLLDLNRLQWRLGCDSLEAARQQIESGLQERIIRGELKRTECWSHALAVGSRQFLENYQARIFSRAKTQIVEEPGGLCVLRETPPPYGSELTVKKAAKPLF
jgi:putative transposase